MRETAWYASVSGGVLALGIGTSLVTASVVGVVQDRDRYRAEAARPRPARTVTVTAPPIAAPSAGPSAVVSPSLVPAGPATVGTTADRPVAAQQTSPGRIRPPQSPVPGGSSSAPGTGPPSPSSCEGAVSARLRLGVLPRCAITIQGR